MINWQKIPNTNFFVIEFVPKEYFLKRPDRASRYLSWELIMVAQNIRDYFSKSVIINNAAWGGDRNYSGLRLPGDPYYSQFSDHSFGQAFDFIIEGMDPLEIRQELALNYQDLGITMLEDGISSWNHVGIPYFHCFHGKLAIVDKTSNIITAYNRQELFNWKAKAA